MKQYNIDENLFTSPIKKSTPIQLNLQPLEVDTVPNQRIYELDVEYNEYNTIGVNTGMVFINGDRNSSKISARMVMNGTPINLDGVTVTLNLKEGQYGYPVTTVCNDIDISTGTVMVHLPPYLVDEIGINTFEFVLTKGDVILISQQYVYNIIESLGEGDIGTETEMSALQSLIQTVQGMQQDLTFDVLPQDIDDIMNMIDGVL